MKDVAWFAFMLIGLLFLSACVTPQPYSYSAPENTQPRSILVLPPKNNTVEVDAPYVFLSTISRPLVEKGYYVFPVSVIDYFLKENGLPTPNEMHSISLEKIYENIGADAVLYVSIEEWGQKFLLFSSRAVVSAKLRLLDVKTGDLLWEATAYAEQFSDDGNDESGGLADALVAAIIDQISSAVVDKTFSLSRMASHAAVFDAHTGLPDGPYLYIGSNDGADEKLGAGLKAELLTREEIAP